MSQYDYMSYYWPTPASSLYQMGLSGLAAGSGLYQMGLSGLAAGSGLNRAGLFGTAVGDMPSVYTSFENALRKMTESAQAFRDGEDVVMGHPPSYPTNYHVDASKAPEDMSLDEYKRYICNKISSMPVSSSMRMNCHGMLVLKEEAFANMQKDPAYEKKILNMLRTGFQTEFPFYAPSFGIQVIGGSEAECYGEGVPVSSGTTQFFGKEKSWWEKRHERIEDYLRGSGMESVADHLGEGRRESFADRLGEDERESLAERLEKNRTSRIQERMVWKLL